MTDSRTRHVYLSPHLDDAVLSCGGAIAAGVRHGANVLVASFFSATPPQPVITPHTKELMARWESGADPMAVRRVEDRVALGVLGARAVHLPFLDCVFRLGSHGRAFYPAKDDIFGPVAEEERALPEQLLCSLSDAVPLGDATVYAPLAAGGHVDHVLVRDVGVRLQARGQVVRFYEDYPYASASAEVLRALGCWPSRCWSSRRVPLDRASLDLKVEAVARYRSQITTFWANDGEMARAMERFARRSSDGAGLAENVWTLRKDCLKRKDAP